MKKISINIYQKNNEPSERSYWMGVTPQKRIEALEELRKSYFGLNYDITSRLQRVCRIVKQK